MPLSPCSIGVSWLVQINALVASNCLPVREKRLSAMAGAEGKPQSLTLFVNSAFKNIFRQDTFLVFNSSSLLTK
jgi:hypothetical protein